MFDPRKYSRVTQLFIAMVILYMMLPFFLPANSVTKRLYQVDDTQYYYLLFLVRIPIIATWCMVFYSYRRLQRYANVIRKTPEGPYFRSIARGMGWIAWILITVGLISTILNAIANSHPKFLTAALVSVGYSYVIGSLFAFSYVHAGTHALFNKAKIRITSKYIRIAAAIAVFIGVMFCMLVGSKLQGSSLTNAYNSLYLANGLVWSTIVTPYLYAWGLGSIAALQLLVLARQSPGVIYKHALRYLAVGVMLIILSMSALQYFRAIIPRTGYLVIGPTLLTTYAIYALALAGSILLIKGVRRLQRIEDI